MRTIEHGRVVAIAAFMLLGVGTVRSQHVLANAGGSFQAGNTSIAFTIGETVIATHEQAAVITTQGFHQPPSDLSTEVRSVAAPGLRITAFPNPAREQVTLVMDGADTPIDMLVLDASGRLVATHRLLQVPYMFDVSDIASGCYTVLASTADRFLASIKLTITR